MTLTELLKPGSGESVSGPAEDVVVVRVGAGVVAGVRISGDRVTGEEDVATADALLGTPPAVSRTAVFGEHAINAATTGRQTAAAPTIL